MKKLLVLGATGLVGQEFIKQADRISNIQTLHALSRRSSGKAGAGSVSHVCPIKDWPRKIAAIAPDITFCALGTTLRKAGSKRAFRAVDHGLVRDMAYVPRESGAKHFILISSVGADSGSRSFYLRTNGEAENAVGAIGFDRLDVLRPGLLRGERDSETRTG